MNLNNYIKSVLSGVKTWALSTFANKRDFDELNSRMYYSEQVEKFFFKNTQISPMDSYGDYVNVSFFERRCDEIRVGDTLNVVWDGTEYECKVFYYDEALGIGNKSIMGTIMGESFEDTGEPFIIAFQEGQFINIAYTDMVSESHVISISGMAEKVHKIDEKYLPEMSAIGAEGTGANAEIFNDYLGNDASGEYSHAEGRLTTASGRQSHAEGYQTIASGRRSHTEGRNTHASGDTSHAEGCYTAADGNYSHAEGYYTTASGQSSHAEGDQAIASGHFSHAEGLRTTAASDYQHVQGKYNVTDDANLYAHIVGNGISDTSRSNAHTIDWDGNAWFAGDVYVGSTSGTNKDDGSKKLITAEELNAVKDGIVLRDAVNGYNYIAQMKNGNLITFCECDHIEITAMPTKTEYVQGEAFDPSGMIIISVAKDGSIRPIENYTCTEYVMSNNIKIQYVEINSVYTITVDIPLTITPFDAATALIDFEYTTNDNGTYTITAWKETLNGEPSTEMFIPDNHLINI